MYVCTMTEPKLECLHLHLQIVLVKTGGISKVCFLFVSNWE